MSEHSKTRQELIEENAVLKEKILELERQSAEEKRTEDALRESEERNRSILQVIPDIIIQTNGHGEYLDVRTSSEELLLLPKKELSGRNIKDLFPEKEASHIVECIKAAIDTNTLQSIEYELELPPGKYFFEARIVPSGEEKALALIRDITEHKKAEDLMRLQSLVLDQIQDLVTITDLNGVITYVNQAEVELLGYGREELIGVSTDKYGEDSEKGATQRKILEETLLDGFWRGEIVNRTVDGGEKIMDCRTQLVRDERGQAVALCGIATDITERKQAEEDLLNSNRILNGVLDGISDIIGIQNPDYTVVKYNKAGYQALGLSHDEAVGRICYSLIGRKRPCEPCATALALKSKKLESVEWYVPELNRYYLCRSNPVLDDKGNVIQIIEHLHDMTERKQAEEALRESEERFRTAMENLPAGLFIHDLEGQLLLTNKAASLNTGYSQDELMAMSVEDVDRGEMTPSEREKMWFDLSQGKTTVFESFHLRKDGSLYPVELHLNPITIGGKPAILALANDITERKHTEEERGKLQAQLTQAHKMESVGRLAGGVAHDFNNMLGIILGHTDMALEYLDRGQPLHSDLTEIRKATMRSADLVRQLLAFARKQTISPKVLDLNDTVEGMLKMLRRLIGEDIDLSWMPGKNMWSVNMDPTQIDQILANLCVNARDAIDGVGKVTIETENVTLDEDCCAHHAGSVPGGYVLLAVSDDGCGMEKEILDKLFEPFFTTKEVGKGTGLGLPMIYGIVKQNKGFINVYSEPGQGATVRIYIPRHIGEAKKEQKPDTEVSLVVGHETVLLVEDEPILLQMGKAMLERLGYRVLSAGRPTEAVKIAAEHKEDIHLLITDVIMPGMNGRDLADQLSASYPDMKLLFMSGYTADVIAHHGVLDPGVKFIQKPFSMKDLANRIREALES